MGSASPSYRGHRYPVEVISHCVWLYFRFPLSFREVEELMLQRGVIVSYETIRRECAKFGQAYANGLRRRRPRPGDKWHLDEVFVRINGELKYLWRAVDRDGNVVDIVVRIRRDKGAARRFFRRLMKKTRSVARVVVADKLRTYGAAHREVMPSVEHHSHKGLYNRGGTRSRYRASKVPRVTWRCRSPSPSRCQARGGDRRAVRPEVVRPGAEPAAQHWGLVTLPDPGGCCSHQDQPVVRINWWRGPQC
ncbi:IS6 family transposase [Streptomyces sp. NBC_00365]|uniref:IS6 family transposase n=1 Tax=Streptomyces sp. NBC_00365 TaxID=2975726 RepID=UPI002252AFC6|nr:IS6 family transposase [Streptomyces sp. NBC_00365]MCX5096517.1 IS6 family transposase [Streptomyces sp. NBC_00365]